MKTTMLRIAGCLALAGGTVIAAASPASAHNYDVFSYFSCANKRPNGSHVIDHSWPKTSPTAMVVVYGCITHDIDTRCEYDVVRWPGLITGPYNQRCRDIPV